MHLARNRAHFELRRTLLSKKVSCTKTSTIYLMKLCPLRLQDTLFAEDHRALGVFESKPLLTIYGEVQMEERGAFIQLFNYSYGFRV